MNSIDNNKDLRPWVLAASILIVVNCLALIPSMAYVPLIPAIKKTITMTGTQLGLFAGMAGVLAIICAVPAGMAIKQFGARKVFLSGVVLMITGLLMLSFSKDFMGALSGRGIWQIGLRFLLPALTAATVVIVPDKYRSTMLGIGIAVSYVGTIIAQNVGAWMSQTSGWQSAIQLFAIIVAVAGLIFFVFYRGNAAAEGETLKRKKINIDPNEPKPRSVYAMPSVWMLCLLVIFSSEEGVIDSFAVVQMGEIWKTNAMQFAQITSIGMVIAIFVNLGAGWCGDKFGRWNMLIVSGILNSFVGICLLIGQSNLMPVYIVGILIAKTLQLTSTLFVNSMTPTFLRGRDIGPIIAIIFLGNGLGQYLGPQVIGIFKDATGAYTLGWIYITVCAVLATLVAVGFKIYFDRKEKENLIIA
jgi:MFS transporter, NNP family, nitrate/nitrite transporter